LPTVLGNANEAATTAAAPMATLRGVRAGMIESFVVVGGVQSCIEQFKKDELDTVYRKRGL
jgi:hypothetical protein